jgi:dTDP-4-amino-4,6-dideoxy-D-galactose acyltransferase
MSGSARLDLLDWDTRFFECRIGRISGDALDTQDVLDGVGWARENQLQCVYLLCDLADLPALQAAEEAGFRLTDVRADLSLDLGAAASSLPRETTVVVRQAMPEDVPALRRIAGESHRNTRFFADARFPREKCTELYEVWIDKSVNGWADHVFVTEHEGRPVGYITLSVGAEARGSIGLIAVDGSARGLGCGSLLVREALEWFQARGCTTVNVATQGSNRAALRLYARHGFIPSKLSAWLHLWL